MSVEVHIVYKGKHSLPSYQTIGSAGMDIHASLIEDIQLAPLERILIPTGLYIALPLGYEAQIRPRSGLAYKQGITCLNAPGTIDSDYRGEIKILLINLSNELQKIQDGDRIAQMIISKYETIQWKQVHQLEESHRGENGFGSTGLHTIKIIETNNSTTE
jgi:dUTP pyrophosphatase